VHAEVLDDDLGLLRDVRLVEADKAGKGGGGLALGQLGILAEPVREPVVGVVGRVAAQHVEDVALFDGLPHRVEVERAQPLAAVRL